MKAYGWVEAATLQHRQDGLPAEPTYALNSRYDDEAVHLSRIDTILLSPAHHGFQGGSPPECGGHCLGDTLLYTMALATLCA